MFARPDPTRCWPIGSGSCRHLVDGGASVESVGVGQSAELRRAVETDAEAAAEVFLRARAEMRYLPRLHTDDETRAFFRDVVMREQEVWVADVAGRVVGFIALSDAMIEHLYVAPGEQGRGVGRTLLDHAKSRRPGGLELWVFRDNAGARRFYERHGLVLLYETNGSGNEEKLPDARYAWRL